MRRSLDLATAEVFRICDFLARIAEVPHYTDAVLDSLAVHLDDGYRGPDDCHHRVHETIAFTQLVTGIFTIAADVTTTHRQLLQLQLQPQLLIVRPGRPPPPRPRDHCIHAACDGHIHHRCWRYYNTQTTTTITTTTTTTNSEAGTTATTASTRPLHSRSLWREYSPSLLILLQHTDNYYNYNYNHNY